jgi:ankyrin repeat protein
MVFIFLKFDELQSGYTALVYATQLPTTTIMQALLRKGANPNIAIRQEGSRGNTPLHFACMLEKPKHAELLLSYGASPRAENQFGMTRKKYVYCL